MFSIQLIKNAKVLRILLFFISCFIGYKLIIVVFSKHIPGQPFYEYTIIRWLEWSLDSGEIMLVSVISLFFYFVGFFLQRKLTVFQLFLWGLSLGAYFALMLAPFDYISIVDKMIENLIPSNKSIILDIAVAIVEVSFLLIVVPLLLAIFASLSPFKNLKGHRMR